MTTVKLTQYVHPYGKPRDIYMDLPNDIAELSKSQVLSCECAPFNYDVVILYSYKKD